VQQTQRGVQAVEVLAIEPPAGSTFALSEDKALATPAKIVALPLEPGRVKWFDTGKGFGFANIFGRHEDVVIRVEVLRRSGFADLQAGKAHGLGRVAGKQGRRAVQGVSWETAVRRGF
jgi:cold shock protein